ncbi:MAG: type II toxin-antitoxin system RelE/ParE family toxin [Thermoflexaceae bacterium]|nr:type II toxin-antitoxin system RelE/ParE family toxin [Thermoflexaceae bacterium]
MSDKIFKVVIADSGKQDVKNMKKYILGNFKYRELGENLSRKIKKAALELDTLPQGYVVTEFEYRGYRIYLKPSDTYLLFYTIDEEQYKVTVLRVLKDGMNWQYILRQWLRGNR